LADQLWFMTRIYEKKKKIIIIMIINIIIVINTIQFNATDEV